MSPTITKVEIINIILNALLKVLDLFLCVKRIAVKIRKGTAKNSIVLILA